jgi:hypothetical protein
MPSFAPPLFQDYFDRAQVYSTTPGANGWTFKKTSSEPTCLNLSSRGVAMTLGATSEVQVATLYRNDVLPWALEELAWLEFVAKVSGVDANTTIAMGLASAQNNTLDTVSYAAWLRVEGSVSTSNVVAESDDNTTNRDDIATGVTLAGTYKTFLIDFRRGLSDVRFGVNGVPVATGTTFTFAGAATTQGLQPYFQLQKGTGTGTPSLSIGACRAKLLRYTY